MTVSTSLPALLPSQQPAATKDKRIRVRNSTGGYGMYPHSIMSRAVKELSGNRLGVFLFVWSRTVNFRDFTSEIPFDDFHKSITGGSRTIRDSIRWLSDNGWLKVQKNGRRSQMYGVDPGMLEAAGCVVEVQPDGGKSFVAKFAKPTAVASILKRKEKEEPKPNLPVVITCNGPAKSQVSGSAFEIMEIEDLEIVRSMLSYGVNKTIITKAFMDMGEPWVNRVYHEFNADVQTAHNMKCPPAVLAKRLRDYNETWRTKQAEPTYEVSHELIVSWQNTIDKNPPDQIPCILRDCAVETKVPFEKLVTLLDTHDAEVNF